MPDIVTVVLLMCLLIWLPVLLYQMSHRGFLVLLIWLLIAPVATNVVNNPTRNPLFQSPADYAMRQTESARVEGYFAADRSISVRWNQLVEPTRTLVLLFVAGFVLERILKRKPLGPFDGTEIWMATFSLILLASALFQSNVLGFSMRTAMDGFIVPFLAYFLMRRFTRSEDQLGQLIRAMGWMGFLVIAIALLERITHTGLMYRLQGPFRTEHTLSIVITVVFFVVLSDRLRAGTLVNERRALPEGVRWFVLPLAPVIILLTWSRGNWVGFLMGVCVFLFLGQRLITRSQKLGRAGLVLIIVAVICLIAPEFAQNEIVEQGVGRVGTVRGRIATWKVVIEEAIRHPIFGIGLFNTRDVLNRKIGRYEGVASWVSAHNSFLQMLAEQGTVGLLAYLAIVASIMRMGLRLYRTGTHPVDRWRGVSVIAIMVAYLTPAFFASTLHIFDPLNSFFVYAFIGGVSGLYGRQRAVKDTRAYPEQYLQVYEKIAPIKQFK